jgi:hypothetical protein
VRWLVVACALGAASGSGVTRGQWTYLATTYDGSNALVYQGVAQGANTMFGLIGSGSVTGTDEHDADPITIGAAGGVSGGSYIDGSIDELRLENLSQTATWLEYDFWSQTDSVISYGAVER